MKRTRNSLISQIWSTCILLVLSVNTVSASVPSFVKNGLYASNNAQVVTVNDQAEIAVVYLDNGLDAGFDIGMTASVYRGAEKIGSVIFVATELSQSAALILELNPHHSIQAGDFVRLNTFRNS